MLVLDLKKIKKLFQVGFEKKQFCSEKDKSYFSFVGEINKENKSRLLDKNTMFDKY